VKEIVSGGRRRKRVGNEKVEYFRGRGYRRKGAGEEEGTRKYAFCGTCPTGLDCVQTNAQQSVLHSRSR
jgi:hypothetical protein